MITSNYWKIPYSNLPSEGKYYPEGSSIRFRCLTIGDLKYMTTIKESNAVDMVNDILMRSLKLEGLMFGDLLKMDRLTLLFYIRTNTFMLSSGYQTEFVCPFCNSKVLADFKMSDLKVKKVSESKLCSCEVTGFGGTVKGVYKKIIEPQYSSGDRDIDLILNNTDITSKILEPSGEKWADILYGLPANEFSRLKHVASDARCGILGFVDLPCTKCDRALRVGVDISDLNLFNKVNLTTMIRNKIQVSKYCGLTLEDDTPYNEVELTVALVNEMSEKEAQEMKKRKK